MRTTVPAGSRVVEGEWWKPDDQGPPLVSFEKKVADGLGLRLGDTVTVNVLGRVITARIANLRALDWQSLGINFVMVFSPGSFRGAPHTDIATLTYPGGSTNAQEIALLKAMADDFPAVTAVRVREALDAVGHVVTNLVLGLRGATALTLLVALLVLGGALAAGHRNRVHDAVVLKVLGASRGRLLSAYVLEYLLVGGATAVFGIAAGSAAAALVLTRVMNLSFGWLPGPAFGRRRRRHRGDGAAGAVGHLRGARAAAGAGAAQPLKGPGMRPWAARRCATLRRCKAIRRHENRRPDRQSGGRRIVGALTIPMLSIWRAGPAALNSAHRAPTGQGRRGARHPAGAPETREREFQCRISTGTTRRLRAASARAGPLRSMRACAPT